MKDVEVLGFSLKCVRVDLSDLSSTFYVAARQRSGYSYILASIIYRLNQRSPPERTAKWHGKSPSGESGSESIRAGIRLTELLVSPPLSLLPSSEWNLTHLGRLFQLSIVEQGVIDSEHDPVEQSAVQRLGHGVTHSSSLKHNGRHGWTEKPARESRPDGVRLLPGPETLRRSNNAVKHSY